jgi:hypothetical protein
MVFCFTTRWYVTTGQGFEVLTAVVMKSTIFWDITPCSPVKVNRRFGRIYRLHLQGRKKADQGTSVKAGGQKTLKMEPICSSETSVDTQRTHGVIFQKIVLFINTAVRTSNPT